MRPRQACLCLCLVVLSHVMFARANVIFIDDTV